MKPGGKIEQRRKAQGQRDKLYSERAHTLDRLVYLQLKIQLESWASLHSNQRLADAAKIVLQEYEEEFEANTVADSRRLANMRAAVMGRQRGRKDGRPTY